MVLSTAQSGLEPGAVLAKIVEDSSEMALVFYAEGTPISGGQIGNPFQMPRQRLPLAIGTFGVGEECNWAGKLISLRQRELSDSVTDRSMERNPVVYYL